MRGRFLIRFIVGIVVASEATAHDLWLVPPETGQLGTKIRVRVISGDKFPTGGSAPDPSLFKSRTGREPSSKLFEVDSAGKDESAGLLQFQPTKAGIYAIGIQTKPKILTMGAEKFNDYLIEDGLLHIYRLRAKERSLGEGAQEQYSKSPKAIFQIGADDTGDPCRPLDLTLEIVPLQNPFKCKVGDALKVQVLFEGKLLAGAHLGWDHPGDGEEIAGTTIADKSGHALIPLAKSGLMTIRLTHMTRPKNAKYEWESFWTTLTFHVPK